MSMRRSPGRCYMIRVLWLIVRLIMPPLIQILAGTAADAVRRGTALARAKAENELEIKNIELFNESNRRYHD